jgi:hypothetical protein
MRREPKRCDICHNIPSSPVNDKQWLMGYGPIQFDYTFFLCSSCLQRESEHRKKLVRCWRERAISRQGEEES